MKANDNGNCLHGGGSTGWLNQVYDITEKNDSSVTFTINAKDMNGSLVDMTVEYAATGAFKMTAVITTTDNKVYHYSYTKTITDKPSEINVFFTGENSYIDGSSLSTGISNPIIIQKKNDGKWFNLSGQQVDKSYKGVVIVNGKKFVNK